MASAGNGYDPAMHDSINIFSRRIYKFVSSPAALILAFASIVFWAASGPHFRYSADWLMLVNSGNNAQSRDTTAINAKLDALILAIEGADNRVVGVEHKTIEETREVHEHLATAVADAESATDDRESIRTR